MFKRITHSLEGIRSEVRALTSTLRSASEALRDIPSGSVDAERLSELEGRIEQVLGIVEAGIIKADVF